MKRYCEICEGKFLSLQKVGLQMSERGCNLLCTESLVDTMIDKQANHCTLFVAPRHVRIGVGLFLRQKSYVCKVCMGQCIWNAGKMPPSSKNMWQFWRYTVGKNYCQCWYPMIIRWSLCKTKYYFCLGGGVSTQSYLDWSTSRERTVAATKLWANVLFSEW